MGKTSCAALIAFALLGVRSARNLDASAHIELGQTWAIKGNGGVGRDDAYVFLLRD